jgi:hypothetical protein
LDEHFASKYEVNDGVYECNANYNESYLQHDVLKTVLVSFENCVLSIFGTRYGLVYIAGPTSFGL